jgi:hypothetical protein
LLDVFRAEQSAIQAQKIKRFDIFSLETARGNLTDLIVEFPELRVNEQQAWIGDCQRLARRSERRSLRVKPCASHSCINNIDGAS